MYYGKMTEELENLIKKYKQLFGYNPCGDMSYEIGDKNYRDFVQILKKCIKNKKELYQYWSVADDDDF